MINMGKPKFSRKKYETPSHPWQEDRIKEESELKKKYGLKNNREVWKAKTKLRRYRSQARELLAKIRTGDEQSKKESDQLLIHLSRLNILPHNSTLDDVLSLNTESILSRRLQTLTYLKGLANTPHQARQLISHGHIAIGDRRITVPSYIVIKDQESEIGYTIDSPLNDIMHPARPRADFKSSPFKREDATKKQEPEIKEKPKEIKTENIQLITKDEKEEIKEKIHEKPIKDIQTKELKFDESKKEHIHKEKPKQNHKEEKSDKKHDKEEDDKNKKEGGS